MSRAELLRILPRLQDHLKRTSKEEELLDEIVCDLEEFLETPETSAEAPRAGCSPTVSRRALKRMTERGVSRLVLAPWGNGRVQVHIEVVLRFGVREMEGALLGILAANGGRGADGFVGWKQRERIALLLGQQFHREVKPTTVTSHINNLRNALEREGLNRRLIQTQRRGGCSYRFALLRDASTCEADNE